MHQEYSEYDSFMFAHGAMIRRLLKRIIIGFIIFALIWNYGLKRPVYQKIFGHKEKTPTEVSAQAVRLYVTGKAKHKTTVEGYDINIKLLKQFYVTARVGYIDRYDGFWGRFYRNTGDGANLAYDKIMPQDVTIAYGKMGQEKNLEKCQITNQYRCAIYNCSPGVYNINETENMHTIAASSAVQAGLDILKKGDVATFEGYLIYWDTQLPSGRILDFESAIKAGQISHQKAGGRTSHLCLQLYLTRLSFDGYVFE